MDIQLSADVFSSSRRKIYLSRSGSIGLPWWWRLVKNIIIKNFIDNEIYELMNVDMEGGLVRGYGSPVRKTSDN